jgi:hypothetical protein
MTSSSSACCSLRWGGSCILVLEPSSRDDVAVIASPPLGTVATLGEELAQPVAAEAGSKGNAN